MSGAKQTPEGDSNIVNRLHFLYQVVEDTQNTIRFIDTKAVFCVTLLSGMAAVVLQRPHVTELDHILLPGFLAIIVLSLLVCMRVIFPTIKPSGSFGAPASGMICRLLPGVCSGRSTHDRPRTISSPRPRRTACS